MFLWKKIRIASICAFILVAASACGSTGPTAAHATLTFWGTFETTQNIQPFITDFKQKYPNVDIQYKEMDITTYESDLINALATGQGPDIFSIHNDWLPKYEDKLAPAPDSVLTFKDYKDAYVDVAVNDFIDGGKIYALPLSVDSLTLYYNKDILGTYGIATPPRTWAELSKDVKTVMQQDNTGFFNRSGVAMGTTANINRSQDIAYLLMLQDRAVPYTPDHSQSTLDQSVQVGSSGNSFYPAAAALSFYTSFANPTSDVYTWNSKSNYSVDAFANGQLAFLYGYSYARDTIAQKAPNLNYDVAPVPQPNTRDTAVNFANYFGVGVSKQSKYPDAAWTFINFMGSQKELKAYYARHSLPSSRKDIIAEQVNNPDLAVAATANLTAKSFYKKDQAKVDSIINDAIDQITLRGQPVNTALSSAVQQINLLNY